MWRPTGSIVLPPKLCVMSNVELLRMDCRTPTCHSLSNKVLIKIPLVPIFYSFEGMFTLFLWLGIGSKSVPSITSHYLIALPVFTMIEEYTKDFQPYIDTIRNLVFEILLWHFENYHMGCFVFFLCWHIPGFHPAFHFFLLYSVFDLHLWTQNSCSYTGWWIIHFLCIL